MAKFRNRYNQEPHLTQDTIWESDKNTSTHHIQEPRVHHISQQVTTRLQKQTQITKKIKKAQPMNGQ